MIPFPRFFPLAALGFALLFAACATDAPLPDLVDPNDPTQIDPDPEPSGSAVARVFGDNIKLEQLDNYANQSIPNYIDRDNTTTNPITDAGATLGRVLFYDKALSVDFSVSCASCHQQAFAFGDVAQASRGVAGTTPRHSMRLVNARFAEESRFFWDERASTLELQTTQPIQDHIEMGFSGQNGDPGMLDLIARLDTTEYYRELFEFVYGEPVVTEARMQTALAQFVRSIQSFDSKYDRGRAQAPSDAAAFTNFSDDENRGKQLFLAPARFDPQGVRIGGGLGCAGCHRPPEFDIDPNSRNNGVITSLDGTGTDFDVTRSPSLRDWIRPDGTLNGPLMHTGTFNSLDAVLDHYDRIRDTNANNPNLDRRLQPAGNLQRLAITEQERTAVTAFMETLAGTAIYTDTRWSDPFE